MPDSAQDHEATEAHVSEIRADTVARIAQAVRYYAVGHVRTMSKEQACGDIADFIEREFPAPAQADTEETNGAVWPADRLARKALAADRARDARNDEEAVRGRALVDRMFELPRPSPEWEQALAELRAWSMSDWEPARSPRCPLSVLQADTEETDG